MLLLYGWISLIIDAQPGSNNSSLFHRQMIEHCLNCYGKRYTENGKNNLRRLKTYIFRRMPHNLPLRSTNISVSSSLCIDKVFYALLEDKVCRGVALMLLQNAVKFNLSEFQEVWQQSVPEGLSTRLEQLKVRLYFSYILHSE